MKLSDIIIYIVSPLVGTGVIWKVVELIRERTSKRLSNVFEKENNLFGSYQNGDVKQLTFLNADKFPLLVKKQSKIIFFRAMNPVKEQMEFNEFKIMSISFRTFREEVVTDQKPFPAGTSLKFEILHPRNPVLSADQKCLLFVIEKYVTASTLVQVEINSGKWKELFSVETFDVIISGKYQGKLLVSYSGIGSNGRQIFYKVCEFDGNALKKFNTEIEYKEFRSQVMTKDY